MGCAEGLVRAAESLLRCAGRSLSLRLLLAAAGDDESEELGLGAAGFRDVELGSCVFRKAGTRQELLVPAEAVMKLVGSLEFDSAAVLFRESAGVVVGDAVLRVESVSAIEAGGAVVCWRVMLM